MGVRSATSVVCSAVAVPGALRLETVCHEVPLPPAGCPRQERLSVAECLSIAEYPVIALALSVSLLVVLGNLAVVAMFVLRWDRRGDRQAAGGRDTAAQRAAEARSGVTST
jgi:hypothetical protein